MSAFQYELDAKGDVACLALVGRIDSVTAQTLSIALDHLIAEPNQHKLVDFSRVDYIGSGGFRSLLAARKAVDERKKAAPGSALRLVLFGLSAEVRGLFVLCKFLDMFEVYETAEQARAS